MNTDLNSVFDLKNLEPKPSHWLDTDLTYEGRGTAELAFPKGTIAGPFIVHFDEHGSSPIETVYETLSPYDPDYNGNHFAFLFGAKLQGPAGKVISWGFSGLDNPCESLSFTTAHGTFMSTGKVDWAGLDFGTGPLASGSRYEKENLKLRTQNLRNILLSRS